MKNLFILRQLVMCSPNQKHRFARVGFRFGTAMILSLAFIGGTYAQQSQRDSPGSALAAQSRPESDAEAGGEVTVEGEDEVALAALASVYSTTSVFIVIGLGLFGLRVSRNLRPHQAAVQVSASAGAKDSDDADCVENQTVTGGIRGQQDAPTWGW
jgi:hypothetical protein